MLHTALLVLALASPLPQTDRDRALAIERPALTQENLDAWTAFLLPAEAELGAEAIQWIPDFAQGVLEASRREQPLLFWAMNGHPLGCT